MVERTLAKTDVHLFWESCYRHPLNEHFYEMAFDHLVTILQPRRDAIFLDAGCGLAYHSMRLARRGFRVLAVDFSKTALATAQANVQAASLEDRVVLQHENLLTLSFVDGQFDYIICWGVLMHIPEVERAIAEISRVLGRGGKLIVSEGNRHAPEAKLRSSLKVLLRRRGGHVTVTPAGIETWSDSPAGTYLTRLTDIPYLIRQFEQHGLHLRDRSAGQFSEVYARLPSDLLKRLVHAFNRFYFLHIRKPGPAMGNLLIFEKR